MAIQASGLTFFEDEPGSLREAVVSLPPQLRSIVQLRCVRQLTFAEIGHILQMQEATVKASFYRALPRLRRMLASHEPRALVS